MCVQTCGICVPRFLTTKVTVAENGIGGRSKISGWGWFCSLHTDTLRKVWNLFLSYFFPDYGKIIPYTELAMIERTNLISNVLQTQQGKGHIYIFNNHHFSVWWLCTLLETWSNKLHLIIWYFPGCIPAQLKWRWAHFLKTFLIYIYIYIYIYCHPCLYIYIYIYIYIVFHVCISKSHRILCISSTRTDSDLWIYHLRAWSNFDCTIPSESLTPFSHVSFCTLFEQVCGIILWWV